MLLKQNGLCEWCEHRLDVDDAAADHDHVCCGLLPWRSRCGSCERAVVHRSCNLSLAHVERYALAGTLIEDSSSHRRLLRYVRQFGGDVTRIRTTTAPSR